MSIYTNQLHFARSALSRWVALATCVALIAAPLAGAQAPAASGNVAQPLPPGELENLVGPIALFPDDLVALILPASTNPLQLVQADRFLEKRKKDPKLQIDATWDDSVKSLVNYPEVIKKMSDDLDWTSDLGEAVVANQTAVLDAVQSFRRKAQSAGNLKTDPKQVVVVEKEIIKIEPADPQVIYVPQYNPTTVVAYSSVPAYGYYPAPYPSYYYPYAPGAALATGLIWGAALGAVWNGGRYGTSWGGGNNNITVNRNTNVNASNVNRSRTSGQSTAWRSDKQAGQVRSGAGRPSTSAARSNYSRPGDAAGGARGATQQRAGNAAGARAGDAAGAGARAGDRAGGRTGDAGGARAGDTGMGARGSSQRSSEGVGGERGATQRSADAGGSRGSTGGMQGGAGARSGGGGSRDALGGYGSGSSARADSSRGASSRSSMSSHGGRSGMSGGGGRRGGGGRGR
jgi:hypothetical protein